MADEANLKVEGDAVGVVKEAVYDESKEMETKMKMVLI